jgi:hypothetical protein
MKLISKFALLMGAAIITATSCKKDEPTPVDPTPQFGKVEIEWEQVWGSNMAAFSLNTPLTHPITSDVLTFTTFKYYVSNIKLKKSDGTWFIVPNSYYLVDASIEESKHILLENVPAGDYTEMEFVMGVDSIMNVSGAQEGALSPTNQLFWSWTTGYIMIKAEGTSPQSSSGNFAYHLGGFSGPNNVVMTRTVGFEGQVLKIAPGTKPALHMYANPARLWHSAGSVSGGSTIHMPGPKAKMMADDFNSWVRFDHIHN